MNSIRVDLGFSAYGNIPTALAGQLDMTSGVTAVGAIHQTATLPVCTRCGASVPIPYQERHAEWHAFVESKIGAEPDEEVRS